MCSGNEIGCCCTTHLVLATCSHLDRSYSRTATDNVGQHPIVGFWNNSNGPLREAILDAVDGLGWDSITIDYMEPRVVDESGDVQGMGIPCTMYS